MSDLKHLNRKVMNAVSTGTVYYADEVLDNIESEYPELYGSVLSKALETAASVKKNDMLKYLIKRGARCDGSENCAIRKTISQGNSIGTAMLLSQHGVNPHAGGSFAIYAAIDEGYIDVLGAIFEKHGDINKEGTPFLLRAIESDRIDSFKALLELGARPSVDNWSFLFEIARKNNIEAIELFFSLGHKIPPPVAIEAAEIADFLGNCRMKEVLLQSTETA